MAAVVASVVLFSTAPSYAVTYTATLLHPVGFTSSRAEGVSGNVQIGYATGPATGGVDHAFLWSGTAASGVDLNPAAFNSSRAVATSGARQVGAGRNPVGPGETTSHAVVWSGTAGSAVDLHPAGYLNSTALGISDTGTNQAGYGTVPIPETAGSVRLHALLWSGSAASVVDIHPAGFTDSQALGFSGDSQFGYGITPDPNSRTHALLWHGTAASVVDLHPAGFGSSRTFGGSATSQVGIGDGGQALLWHGTAESVVSLHPAGFYLSQALGASESSQVGFGTTPATDPEAHALLWHGTAASVVDLHPLLSGLGHTFTTSIAEDISESGVITGWARDASFRTYAVLWTPVPEPAASTLLIFGAAIGLTMHARRAR